MSLEDAFWHGLKEIASIRDMTLSDLVAAIDSAEPRQPVVGHSPLCARLLS